MNCDVMDESYVVEEYPHGCGYRIHSFGRISHFFRRSLFHATLSLVYPFSGEYVVIYSVYQTHSGLWTLTIGITGARESNDWWLILPILLSSWCVVSLNGDIYQHPQSRRLYKPWGYLHTWSTQHDNSCRTGGSISWNPGWGLEPIKSRPDKERKRKAQLDCSIMAAKHVLRYGADGTPCKTMEDISAPGIMALSQQIRRVR